MCNSAVQCGSKKAQSSDVDESTFEYLIEMTTAISPSFPEGRARLYTGYVPCGAGRGESTIRPCTWIHYNLSINSLFHCILNIWCTLFWKYLSKRFGRTQRNSNFAVLFVSFLFSNCFQRYRIISLKWPELKENWLHFRLSKNPAFWK